MGIKKYLKKRKKIKFRKKFKIGLCLSGGGTRGFAHLGAFKAFEENGITFDMIAGTSAGSLFGVLYAAGLSYEEIDKLTQGVKETEIRKAKLGFLPSSTDKLQALINERLPVKMIEKLKTKFFAVAIDLKTGEEIHFSKGDISPIIAGSCAVPGVFLPVKYKNMNLIDGGVKNNIPADVLRLNGCDFVITIDCNSTRGGGTSSEKFHTQFLTSIGIMMVNNSSKGLSNSDIIIRPNMKTFKSSKLHGREEMINEGYNAVIQVLPEIESLFSGEYKKRNIVE